MSKKIIEPILEPNPNRHTLYPIKYHDVFKMGKDAISCFWVAEEIDLTNDIRDWEKLTDKERYFIGHILGFFAASDGIVNENLGARFMEEVQISEARYFYGAQIQIEQIHGEVYSMLIDNLYKDEIEKDKLFNAVENFPCIKKKADWALKWLVDKKSSFATRLVAFACVEGIFFSGSFCSIYWIKEKGIMPGLTYSNELISRDEGMHTDFAVLLYSKLIKKLSKNKFNEIIKDAVNIEVEFICESLPCRLVGMNATLMEQYIKFVADRLSLQFGYEEIYKVSNPFPFMEKISLEGKTNFFEKRVGEYALANKQKDTDIFDFNSEF